MNSSDTEDECLDLDIDSERSRKRVRLNDSRIGSPSTASGNTTSDEDLDSVTILQTRKYTPSRSPLAISSTGASRPEDLQERPAFRSRPVRSKEDIPLGEDHDETVLPGTTAQWLRSYQIDGVCFLYDAYKAGSGRILGDDMGLGKTVQVIAFLNAVFGKNGTKADWHRMRDRRNAGKSHPVVLIICPGTLMNNWQSELNTWSYTHHGRYHGKTKASSLLAVSSGSMEVMLTTYSTYRTDSTRINEISWDVVIADECHIIKEPKSKVTVEMNQVNSRCRIGLTGTAIQNNYNELYTLLNWTQPNNFGTQAEWSHSVSSVLKNGQKYGATNYELNSARKKALDLCQNLLPRVFLRRTKLLIADQLPKKTDRVVFCPLTPTQITAYDNLMQTEEVEFLRDAKLPCDCGSGLGRLLCCYHEAPDGQSFASLMFRYLHYMRQLSNHLALILPNKSDDPEKRERDEALLERMLPDQAQEISSRTSYNNGSDPELCGKWKILVKLLKHWKQEGAKVLVFSSSVKLLDMLNDLMTQHSYSYEYLHGSMSLDERTAAVDNFNNNPNQFVFLISTRAGGVGLNIVSANKVVIFDPNWNPAHDLQAQDRAYRIGQRRDVEVYRLVSVGTVEEVVYARQIYKQQQANIGFTATEERRYFKGVQGDKSQHGELFGIENLLTFHGENHVLRRIFNDSSVAERRFDINMASLEIRPEDIEAVQSEPSGKQSDDFGINHLLKEDGIVANDNESSGAIDPVAAILASSGVEYTHQNSEVIGKSEVEAAITRLAAEAAGKDETRGLQAYNSAIPEDDQSKYQIGSVPPDVQRRQFEAMAKYYKFKSALDFSLVVDKMSIEQRQDALARFYRHNKGEASKEGL